MAFNQAESYGSWSNNCCSKFLWFMEISWFQFSNRHTSSVTLIILICNSYLLNSDWILLPIIMYDLYTSYLLSTKMYTKTKCHDVSGKLNGFYGSTNCYDNPIIFSVIMYFYLFWLEILYIFRYISQYGQQQFE